MTPRLQIGDSANLGTTYAFPSGNARKAFAIGCARSNVTNILCREFGRALSFATSLRAMLLFVCVVILIGVPTQIGKAIVLLVAIVVAGHQAIWAISNKGNQNKKVNPTSGLCTIPTQDDVQVTSAITLRLELSPSFAKDTETAFAPKWMRLRPATLYCAIVLDAIAGKTDDISVADGRLSGSHDSLLESGLWLEQAAPVARCGLFAL